MPTLTLYVNGETRTGNVRDPNEPLLYVLRNALSLTGAKFGCGLGQCGACTVIVDGDAVCSCLVPVSKAVGKKVTTIEGLGTPEKPRPLQAAFVAEQAAQCGVNAGGSVTIYSGKVDLGQGLRIAITQMAAEELGIGVQRVTLVGGDTALTPDQGATAGSSGIMRGGVQIRQAAATAREALVGLAGTRTGRPAAELDGVGGEVRPKAGGTGIGFGDLVGDKRFGLKVDPKAKRRDPASYTVVGKPLARPDIPGKVTGRRAFVQDFKVAGMLHGRVVRPPAVGAKLVTVDESSIKAIAGARVVRINDFLGVAALSEWDAVSAARMLKTRWSKSAPPLGAGEASATPVPAALANAVFDAVGSRLTTVPFTRERVRAALG